MGSLGKAGRKKGSTKPNNRKTVSLRLPPDKLAALRQHAEECGETITKLMEMAVDMLLASRP